MLTSDDNMGELVALLRSILKPAGYDCWRQAWLATVGTPDLAAEFADAQYIEGWIVGVAGADVGEIAEHGWVEWRGHLIELSPVLDGTRWVYFPGLVYTVEAARRLDALPSVHYARRGDAQYQAAYREALAYARAHVPQHIHRETSRTERRLAEKVRKKRARQWRATQAPKG